MSQVILNSKESQVLSLIISHIVLRGRTGQIGIYHGMDRFVSTEERLKKNDVENLKSAFAKLGVKLNTE